MAASLRVDPLSSALGAEIKGVNLTQLSEDEMGALQDSWHANLVILIRDQKLSEQDQIDFGVRFGGGQLGAGKHYLEHEKASGMLYVTNIQENGKAKGILPDGEMQFHSDQSYQESPSKGTILYALEVPSEGGDTLFANAYAAYETLPESIRQHIDGLKALNVYDYDANPVKRGTVSSDAPSWVHPVVRIHPVTKRKSLYVNRLMTARIEGIAEDESAELLEFLFTHQEKPEFVYAHKWKAGDVLIWDNRCALHARTDFDPTQRRLMRRITLQSEMVV